MTFAVTLVFAWFALKVRINADFTSLVPMNAKSAQFLKEYGGGTAASDVLVLAVTADGSGGDVFAPSGSRRCRRRTIGFMGLMGYSLSLVSIVAPPLILIFGNEYAIYTTSELNRVARHEGTNGPRITRAARNVLKPIAMAFLTTVVGFLSLTATDVSQTREFAIAASVRSLSCAFLALVFLPAIYIPSAPAAEPAVHDARGTRCRRLCGRSRASTCASRPSSCRASRSPPRFSR